MISCKELEKEEDLKLSYHILDIKNKFMILSPQALKLYDNMTSAEVIQWTAEN